MDVLLCRQMECRLVHICEYIYKQKWDMVNEQWELLETELQMCIPKDRDGYEMIEECKRCIDKRNYIHLYDCLIYKVGLYMIRYLLICDEQERKNLSQQARAENVEALEQNHKELLRLLFKNSEHSNVEYCFRGTENVNVTVKEGVNRFRLFSTINPWLESCNTINAKIKDHFTPKDIYVLGLGGGHLVNELAQRYPKASIKVYIPNADIFQVIILHISLKNILLNKKIELYYDPFCLDFIKRMEDNVVSDKKERCMVCIDRQEVRACYKNALIADKFMSKYAESSVSNCVLNSAYNLRNRAIGRDIYNYTKG